MLLGPLHHAGEGADSNLGMKAWLIAEHGQDVVGGDVEPYMVCQVCQIWYMILWVSCTAVECHIHTCIIFLDHFTIQERVWIPTWAWKPGWILSISGVWLEVVLGHVWYAKHVKHGIYPVQYSHNNGTTYPNLYYTHWAISPPRRGGVGYHLGLKTWLIAEHGQDVVGGEVWLHIVPHTVNKN